METPTILIPVDFSAASRNAVDYAANIAVALQSNIVLLHVYNLPPAQAEDDLASAMMIDLVQLEKNLHQQMEYEVAYLQKMKPGVEVRFEMKEGMVVETIVEMTNIIQPHLLVMGMKQAGPVGEYLFGSTTTSMFDKIHVPLIAVPEGRVFKTPARLLICLDPEKDDRFVLPAFAKKILSNFSSAIFVISVVDPGAEINGSIEPPHFLEQLENNFYSYHVLKNAEVTEGINAFAIENAIDMIVVFPGKHSLFERIFKEPASKRLAFHSTVPLLSVNIR